MGNFFTQASQANYHEILSFISLIVLVVIHLFANHIQVLGWTWHGKFLSFASGVSFAYVFVDLLPALAEGQSVLKKSLDSYVPLMDKHAYVIALFGVLFCYGLQNKTDIQTTRTFYVAMAGYLLFNFLVGASLADYNNPEIQPIALFTIAIGLHYFVNDHNLRENQPVLYEKGGRWFLALGLVMGYLVGLATHIPNVIEAFVIAFVAGGVLLNVLKYELPKAKTGDYIYFILGALFYTLLIIQLGANDK